MKNLIAILLLFFACELQAQRWFPTSSGNYNGDPATILQDGTHRFVSDANKTGWDAKLGLSDSTVKYATPHQLTSVSGADTSKLLHKPDSTRWLLRSDTTLRTATVTQLNTKVPTSRTINGNALTGNITLDAGDILNVDDNFLDPHDFEIGQVVKIAIVGADTVFVGDSDRVGPGSVGTGVDTTVKKIVLAISNTDTNYTVTKMYSNVPVEIDRVDWIGTGVVEIEFSRNDLFSGNYVADASIGLKGGTPYICADDRLTTSAEFFIINKRDMIGDLTDQNPQFFVTIYVYP